MMDGNGMGMAGGIWMWLFGILAFIVLVLLIVWLVKQIKN